MSALSGIRVVDVTNNQAGPSCGQMLAWLGADVIKVEEPGKGDPARTTHKDRPDADSLFYLSFNGNKRSLTINLKSPRGKDVFRKLLTTADVLLENFGPGVLDRLGFGYAALKQLNPPARTGNQLGTAVPGKTYRCHPGGPNDYVFIFTQQQMWHPFIRAIGREDLIGDARYETGDARWRNRDEINGMIEAWTMERSKHEVMKILA